MGFFTRRNSRRRPVKFDAHQLRVEGRELHGLQRTLLKKTGWDESHLPVAVPQVTPGNLFSPLKWLSVGPEPVVVAAVCKYICKRRDLIDFL